MKSEKFLTSVSIPQDHNICMITYFNFTVKCDPPSPQENINISGYVFPALENAQISVSCLPGYFPDARETTTIKSRCTSEGTWEPDLDLECKPSKILYMHTELLC